MALIQVVAGPYSSSYYPIDAMFRGSITGGGPAAQTTLLATAGNGLTGNDGYTLSWTTHGHRVDKTDGWSKTLIEGIFQGADWGMSYFCQEFPSDANADIGNPVISAWPWGKIQDVDLTTAIGDGIVPNSEPTGGPLSPAMMRVGMRWNDFAGALILTAISGTSASSNPSTCTAMRAIAGQGNNSIKLTSKIREVPVNLVLLPYQVASGIISDSDAVNAVKFTVWFTTT